MTRFYQPDLGSEPDSPFARDANNKLIRRSYWLDMNDRSLVLAMTQGLGANLTNDEKRAHLADLKREHLIDRVCIQEILPPEDSWYLRSRMSEFIFSKRRFIFRFRRDPRIRSIKYANATQRLIQKASPAQSIEGKSPSRGASSSLQQPYINAAALPVLRLRYGIYYLMSGMRPEFGRRNGSAAHGHTRRRARPTADGRAGGTASNLIIQRG
jgi:hypothetical protein